MDNTKGILLRMICPKQRLENECELNSRNP